jgi:hypothetical protein
VRAAEPNSISRSSTLCFSRGSMLSPSHTAASGTLHTSSANVDVLIHAIMRMTIR